MADGRPGRPSPPVAPDSLAERLRQVQARSNIPTDKEFAELAGVSRSTMSAYLNGHQVPKYQTLHRIAEATETDFFWLKDGYKNIPSHPIRPSRHSETMRVPASYGSVLGEVEPLAFREILNAVDRIVAWRDFNLMAEDRAKLAIKAHDFILSSIERSDVHDSSKSPQSSDSDR